MRWERCFDGSIIEKNAKLVRPSLTLLQLKDDYK